MTRDQIIAGFHKLYLENIAKETAKRGTVGARKGGGIPIEALKKIHDDTVTDYVESFLRMNSIDVVNVAVMDEVVR